MQKLSYADLQDQVFEALLFVEKFRKDEFSTNLGIAASTLSLTRKQLKPLYQKFKNHFEMTDADLKAKHEAIATDFDEAMAGGDL
ncbi:hypothetical protein H6F44_20615 [Pseudanabaena sp. FACHB-1277]|uniref:Uncharacterized protein n=1 Tax=Pseudanabaena cinerea FACHB-1277 TaxID=2949581 RepID=A0A926UWG8_9CYAN|nr:hypothetical protein [Pseudanabaena cinerea]MBD2152501.1 hypothetical protein [Pseudanabaena cinerea FACHB-1277]